MTSQSRELVSCYQFYIFLVISFTLCSICGEQVRSSSIMNPRTLFALNFVKKIPSMVTVMEGGGGNFFLS